MSTNFRRSFRTRPGGRRRVRGGGGGVQWACYGGRAQTRDPNRSRINTSDQRFNIFPLTKYVSRAVASFLMIFRLDPDGEKLPRPATFFYISWYIYIYICIQCKYTKFLRDHLCKNKNMVVVIVRGERWRLKNRYLHRFGRRDVVKFLGRKLGSVAIFGMKWNLIGNFVSC